MDHTYGKCENKVSQSVALEWFSSLRSAQEAVCTYEVKTGTKFVFNTRRARGGKGKNLRFKWSEDHIPYIVVKEHRLDCQHGKDLNKAKNTRRKIKKNADIPVELQDHFGCKKTYIRVQGSKKKNCPAHLRYLEVKMFPAYKASCSDRAKAVKLADLKDDLKLNPEIVNNQTACLVEFPPQQVHTGHDVGTMDSFLHASGEGVPAHQDEKCDELMRVKSRKFLSVAKKLNNFTFSGSSKESCTPLVVCGYKVGILRSEVIKELERYPDTFQLCQDETSSSSTFMKLSDSLTTNQQRTNAVEAVVLDMLNRKAHISLKGWRNERYKVAKSPGQPVLFDIERAAVPLLGVRGYGSHMNGYVNHPTQGVCMWIARRSAYKATFPGMLDNMVAGGISTGIGIRETLIKECEEEAGIPEELARNAVSVGMISYIYEDERGIQPSVQYCFDLEIPHNFKPKIVDGEVQEFSLCTIDEVKELIVEENFKPNSAGVILDFLIRKGFILPDDVPDYAEIVQLLHYRL